MSCYINGHVGTIINVIIGTYYYCHIGAHSFHIPAYVIKFRSYGTYVLGINSGAIFSPVCRFVCSVVLVIIFLNYSLNGPLYRLNSHLLVSTSILFDAFTHNMTRKYANTKSVDRYLTLYLSTVLSQVYRWLSVLYNLSVLLPKTAMCLDCDGLDRTPRSRMGTFGAHTLSNVHVHINIFLLINLIYHYLGCMWAIQSFQIRKLNSICDDQSSIVAQ